MNESVDRNLEESLHSVEPAVLNVLDLGSGVEAALISLNLFEQMRLGQKLVIIGEGLMRMARPASRPRRGFSHALPTPSSHMYLCDIIPIIRDDVRIYRRR